MKLLWLDTETSGLSSECGIHQISCIVDINGKEVDRIDYHVKLFPNDLVEKKALSISGVSVKVISSYEDPISVFNSLEDFLGNYVDRYDPKDKFLLSGYNILFDYKKMYRFFNKCGSNYLGSWVYSKKRLCVYSMVRRARSLGLFPSFSGNNKLATVCSMFGININAHNSMSDIEGTKELCYILRFFFELYDFLSEYIPISCIDSRDNSVVTLEELILCDKVCYAVIRRSKDKELYPLWSFVANGDYGAPLFRCLSPEYDCSL
ncbi:MAG: hypothetical protein GY861_21705 [bacterium]|nr:hypothetical protein [bacterium]